MKKLALTLVATLCALGLSAQRVDRVEPLSWFTDMKTPLQLMLHGEQIAGSEVSVDGEGLYLKSIIRTDNPNYLFLDLDVKKAGDWNITLTKGRKKHTFAYHIDNRREGSAQRESFSSKDVVYLIMPDRFANGDESNDTVEECAEACKRSEPFGRHGGDIQGIIDHLDYLADLGVTAIWSTPMTLDNEGFASYHGYSCSDYYHIDPRYGSNELYKEMVAEAHKRGIKFIFDVVTNHCGTAHWWAGDFPSSDWVHNADKPLITNHGWMMQADPVNRSARDQKMMEEGWFDYSMPDMNLQNPLVFNYFCQLYCWWIEWADLDGLRVDTFPYNEKWAMARWTRSILNEYPNLNIVGECWNALPSICAYWEGAANNRDGYSSGLPSVMDFPLQEKIAMGLSSHSDGWMWGGHGVYTSLVQDFLYGNPNMLLTFLDNHDIERFADTIDGDLRKYKIGMAIIATTRGVPQLLYGTEIMMRSSDRSQGHGGARKDFDGGWKGDANNKFTAEGRTADEQAAFEHTRTLLRYRTSEPVLQNGKLTQFYRTDNLYVFARHNEEKVVLTITNFASDGRKLTWADYEELIPAGAMGRSILSGKSVKAGGSEVVEAYGCDVIEFVK